MVLLPTELIVGMAGIWFFIFIGGVWAGCHPPKGLRLAFLTLVTVLLSTIFNPVIFPRGIISNDVVMSVLSMAFLGFVCGRMLESAMNDIDVTFLDMAGAIPPLVVFLFFAGSIIGTTTKMIDYSKKFVEFEGYYYNHSEGSNTMIALVNGGIKEFALVDGKVVDTVDIEGDPNDVWKLYHLVKFYGTPEKEEVVPAPKQLDEVMN